MQEFCVCGEKGSYDLEAPFNSEKHKKKVQSYLNTQKRSTMPANDALVLADSEASKEEAAPGGGHPSAGHPILVQYHHQSSSLKDRSHANHLLLLDPIGESQGSGGGSRELLFHLPLGLGDEDDGAPFSAKRGMGRAQPTLHLTPPLQRGDPATAHGLAIALDQSCTSVGVRLLWDATLTQALF
ncbi:UNVERIFIED_CONTAM: hypothetical protein K2H54_029110 [Gekko kuhli]